MTIDDARKKSIQTGSGIDWESWLAFFEPHKDLDHTALAQLALAHITTSGQSSSPEWWAQGVTVAYEQHIGRRGIGQRCDGSFSATVSKTLAGDMDEVLEALITVGARHTSFTGVPGENPRTSQTEKWRYWRVDLADESKVTINVSNKAPGKAIAAVNHDNLADRDIAEIKAWWKDYLGEVAEELGR